MDEPDVTAAIKAFFEDLDIGLAEAYPYPISNTTGELPDVVIFVQQTADTDQPPPEFQGADLQEVWWRIFTVTCDFMVAVSEQTEAAASAAWATVESMAADIRRAIRLDASLGGALAAGAAVSPRVTFSFEEPFVAREDQVRGRHFSVELLVGERIVAPEGAGAEFSWPGSSS